MLLLAFDTSISGLSCALLQNERVLDKSSISDSNRQSELLVLEIEKILKKNNFWYHNLDAIATINGPGSFTGIRVGLTAARTMKIALNKPLILVNSCEVIAYKYKNFVGKIAVVLDAKMDEFFVAHYLTENSELKTLMEPCLVSLEKLQNFLPTGEFLLCGSGKNIAKKLVNNAIISEEEDVLQADLVGLVAYEKFINANQNEDLNPLYLRMPRIEKRKR